MKLLKKVVAAVTAVVVSVTAMSFMSFASSAENDVFFKFAQNKQLSSNGTKSITYSSNGIRVVSDDNNIQNCNGYMPESDRRYIQAVYDVSEQGTQSALQTLQTDKRSYRVSADIYLHKVVGVKTMRNIGKQGNDYTYHDWYRKYDKEKDKYLDLATVKDLGFASEVILIFTGKDENGKTVTYRSEIQVSSVERPKKTLVTNLPKNMASVDTLTVRFAQSSGWITAIKSLDCEVSNLKVTKLATPTNPIQEPKEGCLVDYTDAYIYSQLGLSRIDFSAMVDMTVDESSELYPNSAMSFYGKGFVGPDQFHHGWEDVGVSAGFDMGKLSEYDGVECYVLSRKTDMWTVGFTIDFKVMLPNRDAKGNYLDKNGKKVSGIDKAYFFPWTFMIPEQSRPAAHAGTVMKFTFDFKDFKTAPLSELMATADRIGADIGEYYDDAIENGTISFNEYKKYAYCFNIEKGLYAFTGKDIVVDFSVGDLYGCKYDKYGDLTSNMPAPAAYVDPNPGVNTVDSDAVAKYVELYTQLPKDAAAYYNDPDGKLKEILSEYLALWGTMNKKTKKELELTYGYTEKEYMHLALIWDDVYGESDGPTAIDLDYDDDFGFDVNPDSGTALPITLSVSLIGTAAVLTAIRRKRKA